MIPFTADKPCCSKAPQKFGANRNANKKPQLPKQKTNNFATAVKLPSASQSRKDTISQDTSVRHCPLCGDSHDLDNCDSFRKKTMEERKSFLTEKRLGVLWNQSWTKELYE